MKSEKRIFFFRIKAGKNTYTNTLPIRTLPDPTHNISMNHEVEVGCCAICLDDLVDHPRFNKKEFSTLSSLTCTKSSAHRFHVECLRPVIRDSGGCNRATCGCFGYYWPCPLCRNNNVPNLAQMKALLKNPIPLTAVIDSADDESIEPLEASHQQLPATSSTSTKKKKRFFKNFFSKTCRGRSNNTISAVSTTATARIPPVPKSNNPTKFIYTTRGLTTSCVSCANDDGKITPAVTADFRLVALSCSEGHAMCMKCSRKIIQVRDKCMSADCPGVACKKNIKSDFNCVECKKVAVLARKHVLTVIRGGWG